MSDRLSNLTQSIEVVRGLISIPLNLIGLYVFLSSVAAFYNGSFLEAIYLLLLAQFLYSLTRDD